MNAASASASATRSDASTSTDDVKGRPLCLFYFTHPFGVLSPEAPRVFDMESAPPFCWPSASDSYRSSSPTPAAAPVPVRRGAPQPLLESLSSSLLSSETWYTPAASCSSGGGGGRRYARILPPLRLPSPRDLVDYSSDDVWPCRRRRPPAARFSLPPIELPLPALPPPLPPAPAPPEPRARRPRPFPSGVDKRRRRHRRARAGDLRRLLTRLIRRTITEGRVCRESSASASASVSTSVSPAPALRRALHTLRDAWAPSGPRPARCDTSCRSAMCSKKPEASKVPRNGESVAMNCVQVQGGVVGRADASPGLLRRRYSVPETVMRKYRLAQQGSETEEATSCARHSAGSGGGSPARSPSRSPSESPHRDRLVRRDRELMRKSALLRRLWARPAACACCGPRSLAGSRAELRRSPTASPLAWTSPERRRLERGAVLALAPSSATATATADSTFQSHAGDGCSCTDVFTDSEISEAPTAPPAPIPPDDGSYTDSDPFSTSLSTAKETAGRPQEPARCERLLVEPIERRGFERSTYDARDGRNALPYDRPLAVDTATPPAPYELLEIVVSETASGAGAPPPPPPAPSTGATGATAPSAHDLDIDRYVSNILVESLNSLTDQLECMNASIGNDRKLNIVQKEIKVRLQNTGVNTIVHLSPTSNHQIIFGNEELCNDMRTATATAMATASRDECNNPLLISDEPESNDNDAPPRGPPPPSSPPVFDALQHDDVNEAVLQQIQKLFRDELRHLDDDDDEDRLGGEYGAGAHVSRVEISDAVDVYGAEREHERGDVIGGVGAGNYFCDSRDAVVPRFSAFPHTESMEVNTSSSEEAELAGSECTSLVDSLDDPNSPRVLGAGVASARRRALVRSAIDVLDLLPERAAFTPPAPPAPPTPPAPPAPPEAFFVRIEDDRLEPDPDEVRVAEYMPEKIKQRLYRRHRKRELRMECARRGKNQLKRELEMRRREDAAHAAAHAAAEARRRIERECRPLVDELLDDVIAKIVHDEFKCMRIKRRNRLQAAKSDETLSRRTRKATLEDRRTSLETAGGERCRRLPEPGGDRSSRLSRDGGAGDVLRTEIHGKLLARPSASFASSSSSSRPPRRFYQKSEIREGDKCIEILEILEYVNGSQSSPEATASDDGHGLGSRSKRSRIPVPVYERSHRPPGGDHMRLTGGDGGRSRAAAAAAAGGQRGDEAGAALAELLLEAFAPPSEPRSRSNSLRFKRVFDMIPEERSSLSLESSASCEESAARAARSARSAATSPPPRPLREQTTMTSPCNKSAGTSPMRPPPAPAAAPPPREGYREVGVGPIESPSAAAAGAVAVAASAGGQRGEEVDRGRLRGEDSTDEMPGRKEREGGGEGRRPPPSRAAAAARCRPPPALEGDSSDSGDSGGSLLCSLAPRWLATQARRDRRRTRRAPTPAPPSPPPLPAAPAPGAPATDAQQPTGGWSVTVAGSCRAALPHDVEMRLRFPHEGEPRAGRAGTTPSAAAAARHCACVQCAACASAPRPALPSPPPHDPTLTLTMKKEAQDSSIVASKTSRKSREHLPELETYRASRSKVKSSMKTRRGYSLHCWLPDDEPAPIRGSSGLSVLGCAIIPELKPRVPTMSERDLTRIYTPRHYLRS